MVNMQMLRAKTKVLDMSYGNGTGKLGFFWLALKFDLEMTSTSMFISCRSHY